MKRTFDRRVLPVTSAMAAALLATGCSRGPDTANSDVAVCRDAQGRRPADSGCSSRSGGSGGGGRWHYIARGGAVPRVGDYVTGGSSSPMAGRSYTRASAATVTRGGFGLSARSSGG